MNAWLRAARVPVAFLLAVLWLWFVSMLPQPDVDPAWLLAGTSVCTSLLCGLAGYYLGRSHGWWAVPRTFAGPTVGDALAWHAAAVWLKAKAEKFTMDDGWWGAIADLELMADGVIDPTPGGES